MKRILLVVSLVLFIWVGSGAVAYTVVELTGAGPPGPQGEQGERGPRGLTGEEAFVPVGDLFLDPCSEAIDAYEEGLSTPGLSEQQVIALYDVYVLRCGRD